MRLKLGLAIAILRDTPGILMDEPTSGQDPTDASDFLQIVCQLRERGKAILMATREILRIKEIADRVGIMKEGRKVMERTRAELRQENLELLYMNYMRGSYRADHSLSSLD